MVGRLKLVDFDAAMLVPYEVLDGVDKRGHNNRVPADQFAQLSHVGLFLAEDPGPA